MSRGNVAVLYLMLALGCGHDATGPTPAAEADIAKKIPLYSGSIGLVVDARDIFKRGYKPRTAEISFAGQPSFNSVLTIDSLTDVAILVIEKDSLSVAQKNAFAAGIATTIVIRDANHSELGRLEDVLNVDDSNQPLSIATSLPALTPPLVLGRGAAYLLQAEGYSELITRVPPPSDENYKLLPYPDSSQQFTFTQKLDSTYLVGHVGAPDSILCVHNYPPRRLELDSLPSNANCVGGEADLVLEQDPDGWMRVKDKGSGDYVAWTFGGAPGLYLDHLLADNVNSAPNSRDDATRFRLISDDIDLTISDQGTSFDQPIMPLAHLAFAYLGTLTNCSSATLTETVGDDITQSTATTFTTLETVQLFTGNVQTVGVKVSASAKVKLPAVGETTITAEVGWQGAWTTNKTVQTDNTTSTTTTSTVAVSRSRQLQVPPFKALTVADYVKSIDNVVQPFTQKSRLRGVHRSNGAPLSGQELVTLMRFNFAQGVTTRIAANYVEFTIRGEVHVDKFLLGETLVRENVNGCQ